MLVDAGVATDVSEAMILAAEAHWKLYSVTKEADPSNRLISRMDFLFAVWPDLGTLIQTKAIDMQIAPAPRGVQLSDGCILYSLDTSHRRLTVMFQTQRWRVNLVFDGSAGPKSLYDLIFAKPTGGQ